MVSAIASFGQRQQQVPLLSRLLAAVIAFASAASADTAPAPITGLPAGFMHTQVLSGLGLPMSLAFLDSRLFVALKNGTVLVAQVFSGGAVGAPSAFLTVPGVSNYGDGGLMSLAFDPAPDAADPARYVYVQYLVPGAGGPGSGDHSRVSRFTVDPANRIAALPASERVLFEHSPLAAGVLHHFGGALSFGADGMLYSSHGAWDTTGLSQALGTSLGKVSRFTRLGVVPADGPFFNAAGASGPGRAAWAIGLRNPFTTAKRLQSPAAETTPTASGADLLIFDVGENAWEEVNEGVRGANYGERR